MQIKLIHLFKKKTALSKGKYTLRTYDSTNCMFTYKYSKVKLFISFVKL